MRYFKNILLYISILGVFILHPSLNKSELPFSYLHYLAYGNTLKLKTDAAIDKNHITIKWFCSNFESTCNELTIVENGKKTNEIPNEIGTQALIVYYKNQIIGKIKQVKQVKNQAHTYYLALIVSQIQNSVTLKVEITGPTTAAVVEDSL